MDLITEATERLENIVKISPTTSHSCALGSSYRTKGIIATRKGNFELARIAFENSLEVLQRLVADVGSGDYVDILAKSQYQYANYFLATDEKTDHPFICVAAPTHWVRRACVALVLICLGFSPRALGQGPTSTSSSRCVMIEVYGRQGDPNKQDAVTAVEKLASQRSGITLVVRDIDTDPRNQERLNAILKHFKLPLDMQPVVYGCNRVIHATHPDKTRQELQELLQVEAFVRSGCNRCVSVKARLPAFLETYPALELVVQVVTDRVGSARVSQLTAKHRVAGASVPIVYLCDQLLVGFETEILFESRLRKMLQLWTHECPKAIDPSEPLPPDKPVKPSNSDKPSSPDEPKSSSLQLKTQLKLAILSQVFPLVASSHALLLAQEPEEYRDELPIPGLPSDMPEQEVDDTIRLPFWGSLSASKLGMPLFTIAVGLVDGFNPCAMWVLLYLLSILVNLRDRVRIVAIAGTFVVVSGLAYYAFMAAWINVFMWVGYLRSVQVGLAILAISIGSIHIKDFFAFKQGVSLSIPESAKPGIYARVRKIVTAENLTGAIAGAFTLAVLVNFIELLCTAGLPALYTRILTQQNLSWPMRHAYLGLYIGAYMLDDTIMVLLIVATLSKKKLQESQGRWLKLASGIAILLLGIIMMVRPEWLR